MSKDKVIVIDFSKAWREMIIIALSIILIVLLTIVVNNTQFESVPVKPHEAVFYDCVSQCYYDSWGGDDFYEVGLAG